MKKIYLKMALVLSALSLTIACTTDDNTDASTQTPTAPTLSINYGFADSQTLVEQDSEYPFTVTLSQPQIVDVLVYLTASGTATNGADYDIPPSVRITAGSTSATGTITIHADDSIEDTETATITIGTGDEANAVIESKTVMFNIQNLTEGDLGIGLSWDMPLVTDNSGNEINATDFADLRLLVTDVPYTTIIDAADGGSFETYTLTSDSPDGEYYVVADFFDASDIVRDIDLTLTFDQVGVINGQTYSFPAALNNASICEANYYVMVKITKTGGNYTFEKVGEPNFKTKSWSGIDTYDFYAPSGWTSHITSSVDCDGSYFLGLNAEWILQVWGEEVQVEGNVYYTIDGSGNITIPSQFIFTTLFGGNLYDYTVSGTGTYDDSGTKPVIHLEYKLDQDGFDVAAYWNSQGGMDTPYFVADITAE